DEVMHPFGSIGQRRDVPHSSLHVTAVSSKGQPARDSTARREGHRRVHERAASSHVTKSEASQGLERSRQSADDLEASSAPPVSDAFLHVWPSTTLRRGERPVAKPFAVRSAKKSPAQRRISSAAQLRDLL